MTITPTAPAGVHAPGAAADVAAAMLFGRRLYPHQAEAAAIIDTPGTLTPYAYTRIVIVAPRQTGKTTLILCVALGRALTIPDYRAVYAAQTGHITTKRFTEWRTITGRGANARRFRNRASAGTERITPTIDLTAGVPVRREPGGYLEAFPPIPGRLRSAALDLVVIDEAQEHSGELGQKLDADLVPVFDTRPRGQTFIAGTAGGLDAEYFRHHYQLAKDGAPGYLLIEYGTPPAGAPLDDPATWEAHHPGVLAGMTTVAKLDTARGILGPQRFAREYLNQWDTAGTDSVFPPGTWTGCRDPDATITGRAALALEVDPDRDSGVIAVAGASTTRADAVHVDVIGPFPLSRLVDAAVELTAPGARFAGVRVAVDPQAPTVTHIARLKRARVPLHTVTLPELVASSLGLFDRVKAGTLTHIGDALLDVAASAAKTRPLGARWAFDRLAPSGHVITAAAVAVHRAAEAADTPDRTFAAG